MLKSFNSCKHFFIWQGEDIGDEDDDDDYDDGGDDDGGDDDVFVPKNYLHKIPFQRISVWHNLYKDFWQQASTWRSEGEYSDIDGIETTIENATNKQTKNNNTQQTKNSNKWAKWSKFWLD